MCIPSKVSPFLIIMMTSITGISQPQYNLDKVLKKEIVVNTSRSEVWQAFTTEEGARTFFAPDCKIELWIGGKYEIYFSPEKEKGFRRTEGCKVLSFIPEKMLSVSWNAPPEFPEERNVSNPWIILEFDELTPDRTKVTLTHVGWGNGGNWNEIYNYFDKVWDIVFNSLKAKFSGGSVGRVQNDKENLFIYIYKLTEKYQDPEAWTTETEKIIEDHAQFLNDLGKEGVVIQAGRTLYSPGNELLFGIIIVKAESLEEAKKLLDTDPSILRGVQEATVHPFSLGIRHFYNLN